MQCTWFFVVYLCGVITSGFKRSLVCNSAVFACYKKQVVIMQTKSRLYNIYLLYDVFALKQCIKLYPWSILFRIYSLRCCTDSWSPSSFYSVIKLSKDLKCTLILKVSLRYLARRLILKNTFILQYDLFWEELLYIVPRSLFWAVLWTISRAYLHNLWPTFAELAVLGLVGHRPHYSTEISWLSAIVTSRNFALRW